MSRIVHRQPIWTWSLVLLSTLLLTPSTAAVVLAALRQANLATVPPAAAAAVSARRATTQEEEAIKAAAQSGRLKLVRLEPAAEQNTLAILAPTCLSIPQPESCTDRSCFPVSARACARGEHTPCGSRAPPPG